MVVIRHTATRVVLADRAELATGLRQRMVGLLGRAGLPEGGAMVFPRCNAIHTWFMRFPIDVVFLRDRAPNWHVVRAVPGLRPFRLAWVWGADTVVELPAGTLARTPVQVGESLDMD